MLISNKSESVSKKTNCPHCGVLVSITKLRSHVSSRCPKNPDVKRKPTKTSPSIHIHKTIKHVTKAVIDEMPKAWLKNINRTGEELRALYAGKPLVVQEQVNQPLKPKVNKLPIEPKNLESFPDKWIRLFSEKGYSFAMVEAFKREANKQHLTAKEIHDFLQACKPNKKAPLETPVKAPASPVEAVVEPLQPITIVTPVKAPVAPHVHPMRDVEEQALFSDRVVKARVNQADFKQRVAANFSHACAVTGSREALEAAHIEPVSTGNNNTSNGVLLLVSLHRLFDAGLMAINPESLTVHFKPECSYFAKDMLEGKKLSTHSISLNINGLEKRWKKFKSVC